MSDELQREMLKQLRDLNHRVSHLETLEYLQRHRREISCEEIVPPIDTFGICNGQFELDDPNILEHPQLEFPDGWVTYQHPSGDENSYARRVTGGMAGNYAFRGGNTGTAAGVYLLSLKYIPVDEDRDYYISWVHRGSVAAATLFVGVACYDAAKNYIGVAWGFGGNAGVAWIRKQKRIGPNGNNPFTANTRYVKIFVYLQHNAALADAWVEIDDIQFQQMKAAYSSGITLIDDYVQDPVNRGFDKQAYTAHAGSVMNLTLEEESYIWYFYQMAAINATRAVAQSFYTKVYIDGVGQPGNNVWCSPGINYYVTDSFSQRSQAPYAMGPHTIDYRLWVANAGDVVWVGDLTGSCFAVRQY